MLNYPSEIFTQEMVLKHSNSVLFGLPHLDIL